MRVQGSVALPASVTKAREAEQPQVILSVYEGSSVTCDGVYAQQVSPGRRIHVSAFEGFGDFDFEVESQVEAGVEPSLQVEVLVDLNGNGFCDDGEPQGLLGVPSDGDLGDVSLPPGACSARL